MTRSSRKPYLEQVLERAKSGLLNRLDPQQLPPATAQTQVTVRTGSPWRLVGAAAALLGGALALGYGAERVKRATEPSRAAYWQRRTRLTLAQWERVVAVQDNSKEVAADSARIRWREYVQGAQELRAAISRKDQAIPSSIENLPLVGWIVSTVEDVAVPLPRISDYWKGAHDQLAADLVERRGALAQQRQERRDQERSDRVLHQASVVGGQLVQED